MSTPVALQMQNLSVLFSKMGLLLGRPPSLAVTMTDRCYIREMLKRKIHDERRPDLKLYTTINVERL